MPVLSSYRRKTTTADDTLKSSGRLKMGNVVAPTQFCTGKEELCKENALIDVDRKTCDLKLINRRDDEGCSTSDQTKNSTCQERPVSVTQQPDDNGLPNQNAQDSHNKNIPSIGNSLVVNSHRRQYKNFLIRGGSRLLNKASGTFTWASESLEDFFFPKNSTSYSIEAQSSTRQSPKLVRGGILLYGCKTAEEHYALIKDYIIDVRDLRGAEGLKKIGLEYRFVPCELHRDVVVETDDIGVGSVAYTVLITDKVDQSSVLHMNDGGGAITASSSMILDYSELEIASRVSNYDTGETSISGQSQDSSDDFFQTNPIAVSEVTNPQYAMCRCHYCMRKLFHIESNQLVQNSNRKEFIADGDMYEVASRLVQEAAFDVFIEEADLKWLTIWEPDDNRQKPIQALINADHPMFLLKESKQNSWLKQRPTLFVFTGRGKVRAGIFSRQHLICDGMEGSTCLPFVREAQARNLNVFIIDPNVNGDAMGYITFQKTMDYWCDFGKQHPEVGLCRDVFILSHSASGGHLVRYLLEPEPKEQLLPFMKAVAFTDSTHSLQWTKSLEHQTLHHFIQCDRCVYFRCGKTKRDTAVESQWHLHPAGEEIVTDSYWQHRFGLLKTMWAGTDDHSLTNWFALAKIWEHFDQFLYSRE
jgi:hypothetical protein